MRTGLRFIAAALLLLAGCNPHQNDTPAAFISFGDMFDKTVAETAGTVTTVAFQAGGPWSARSNAAWLTATPDSGGAGDEVVRVEVTANETGRVRMGSVTFTCGSDKKTLHVTQNAGKVDPGTEPTYGPLLTDGFSQDLHYSTARLRTTSAVMQSFDIASDGMIYYTQLNSNFRVYLSWNERNSQETPTARCMTLCYTGHGSNFTLEEATDGKYIWIDNYSSKNNKGEYWNAPGKRTSPSPWTSKATCSPSSASPPGASAPTDSAN